MQQKKPFIITTDSMSDLSADYLKAHDIEVISLTYTIDGQTYDYYNGLSSKDFYNKMRVGSQPMSSQFNPADAEAVFERLVLEHGCDILHVSISSGLSGSVQSASQAAKTVMERHPGIRIIAFDSLGASLGEGILVTKAVEKREEGLDVEATNAYLESIRDHVCYLFTVDDIIYLYRGGRVSKTTAILGGMLDIKPLIKVDYEGHLIPTGKVRGRKRSLMALVSSMEEHIGSWKDQNKTIYITHGDAEEDAKFLARQIEDKLGFTDFDIQYLGTTIGVHTGPGLIALFFLAEKKF